MLNKILVSVITISYNQENFIENTIKSVLNQGYPNIEYIVIDAGSSDRSREIIMKYKKKISKIIFEQDDGPADGLNKGFKIAKGDILCWLNSDDILLDRSIEKVVKTFQNNKDIDVVYGNAWITDQYGNRVRKFHSDNFNVAMALYGASIISQQSTFIKKQSYLKVAGFNKSNKISWDSELFLDLGLNGSKFYKTDEFLSCLRMHDEGITGSGLNNEKLHDETKKILSRVKKRKFNKLDNIIFYFFYFLRKLLNLNDTYERIKKGPVNKANKENNNIK
jgi:glycosyltransferase involved in cell wall biosynthesis